MALLIVWCSDMGKVVFVLLFCLFCFLSLSVSCCVLVGVCFIFLIFFWGVEVWVGLFCLKSPDQFISCFLE